MNAEISLKRRILLDCLRACSEAPLKRFIIMRQSSSRNQRYKGGFRFRHFLQICLLLVICIWLVYQVKHSHDKKIAFVERKGVEEQPFSFQFGRKDLPIVKEIELVSQTDVDVDGVEGGEDEILEQEMKKEDAQDEDIRGDVDDWIDVQDQDQRDEENEQEVEFENEEENQSFMGEANSVDLVDLRENDSVLDEREENNKRDNVSRAVSHENHMTEPGAGHADSRGLEEEKPDDIDANMKGSSSTVTFHVSNNIYNSSGNGDLTSFVSNLSRIGFGENTNSEATNHSMNGTSSEKRESVFVVFKHENGSISSPISAKENNSNGLLTNSKTATLPVVTAISTANMSERLVEIANHSTVADSLSYKENLGNKTASLITVGQKHTLQNATSGENHSKLVNLVAEFDHNLRSQTSEEQESEDQFATISFSKDEVNLSHNAVTEEEREARTDLPTLPEINNNDVRHDYDVTEQ